MANVAILWDIENVRISKKDINLFLSGLNSYCEGMGKRSYSAAVGDWLRDKDDTIPRALSENGFELIYIPQLDNRGNKTKDSVDFILMTKATEMIFQYPHIDNYIILTSDIDFRPLVQLLKKHGKTVSIIYNLNNVSEGLLEFVDDHKDYREFIPDETDNIHDTEINKRLNMDNAYALLVDAVDLMESKNLIPTPGSVKVRMKMINNDFSQENLGISNWMDFILDSEKKGYIKTEQKNNDTIIHTNKKLDKKENIFTILINIMENIPEKDDWILFTKINQEMLNMKIKIKDYNYTKFKKLALEAEDRKYIEIKNDGLKWFARVIKK